MFDGLNITLTATSLTITSNGANASYVFTAFKPDSIKTVLFSFLEPETSGFGYPYTGQLNVVLGGTVVHSGGGTISTSSPTFTPQPTQIQPSSNPTIHSNQQHLIGGY